MSKFLKAIVNIILLVAILSAGALLIPPLLGVTTKVSNGTGNTNLSRGSVTYATSARANELETGDKILREDSNGSYVYTVSAIASDTSTYTLKDEVSQKTQEQQLTGGVQKVVLTLPVIGMLSLTLQSREGIIILGLCVAFLIILFILSEVWRHDEEEDEEDDDEEDDENEEADEEEERPLTRREKRRLKKERRKKEAEEENGIEQEPEQTDAKQEEANGAAEESADGEGIQTLEEEPEEEVMVDPAALVMSEKDGPQNVSENIDENKELEESLAEAVGEMLGERTSESPDLDTDEAQNVSEETDTIYIEETASAQETDMQISDEEGEEETKEQEESPVELAIPVHTAEELLRKAEDNGDHPKVIEDRETGVTILDYSEIL